MSATDIGEQVRKAVYDLVWQTAHLYKDAPGGKLACSQRSRLARYVESKMMEFDCILENREDASALKETVEAFLRDLEDSFRAAVHQEEAHLSFYEERKRECLEEIAAAWNAVVNAGGRQRE